MSMHCPGAQFANGATRAIVEPTQILPISNGVGDQNRDPAITTLVQSVGGAQGVLKRAPADSGIPGGVDPL